MNEIIDILSPALGDELARDIIAHRKGLRCPLTPRGARSLLKQYEMTGNAIEAAEEHLNRGWQGFKAEWMTRERSFLDPRNPMRKNQTELRQEAALKAFSQSSKVSGYDQFASVVDLEPADFRTH